MQRYCAPRLQAVELEFLQELEKKRVRDESKREGRGRGRWPQSRRSVETSAGLKESRLTFESGDTVESTKAIGLSVLEDSQTTVPVDFLQLSSYGQRSRESHTPSPQSKNLDLTQVAPISEIASEDAENCEEFSAQPRPEDLQSRYTPEPRIRVGRYTNRRPTERLPPPAIPYTNRSGDVMAIHIVGEGQRKASLDLRRRRSETPRPRNREEMTKRTGNVHIGSSRTTSKSRLDDQSQAKKASNSPSRDHTPSPRAQFHVFRDISLDEAHKIDAERRVIQSRMRKYAVRTKLEFMPVPSERKRIELLLIREKRQERLPSRKFRRVGLQALAKIVV